MNGFVSSVPAVRIEGVVKRFGATVALDGAGLEVPGGMVFGLLGPNGAGKTTLVRILATLLAPEAGRAEVFGHDVGREPAAVRELIGLTGQFAAVDELLTGRENLEMSGRLFKLSREQARRRAGELLDRFDLAPAADRPARTYSGGMRRRLDIASTLADPPAGAVPRRADHGPGSAQPQRDLGRRARAAARGDDDLADHPVPGGSRSAGRPDRGHRPREGDRGGNRERAQGPRRRPDPGGGTGQRGAAGPGAGAAGRGGLRRAPAGRAPGPA